ncbi:MAG: RNA polymerase sigma factor [Bacteroidota bacterium]
MQHSELEYLLKAHHREAFLWARQCCYFDDELAKDILQQCYLKILEGKAKLHQPEKIKSWLFSIIRFTAIDELRKIGKIEALEENYDAVIPEEELEERNYDGIIQLLPLRQREVILAVFYHNMTIEEAAETLQITLGTARTHYERGKKKLKELILKTQLQQHNGQ